MLPVIIVHKGNSDYLKYTIECSRNSGNHVVLIGDMSNSYYAEWVNYKDYESELHQSFRAVYEHMSPNHMDYELISFDRHYYVYEYCRRNQIDRFFMSDSDELIYTELKADMFESYDFVINIPERSNHLVVTAQSELSYWTLDALRQFLEYINKTYKYGKEKLREKWNYLKNMGFGGVCDMTLLYMFSQETSLKFGNTQYMQEHGIFDPNVNTSRVGDLTFEMDELLGIKKITEQDGKLYFRDTDGKLHRALTIQAQGRAKRYMKDLSMGKETDVDACLYDELRSSRSAERRNELKYRICYKWMIKNRDRQSISDFLNANGYHTVAIYGMGLLGMQLYDELAEKTQVKYGIDKNKLNISGYVIKNLEDDLEKVDLVIITACSGMDAIRKHLSSKLDCDILHLDDLLNRMEVKR